MFSSEDEQDDRGIFDQLKSIKPFTVHQLYLLHPDVGCPPKAAISSGDDNINDDYNKQDLSQSDREIYQQLVEHEQFRKQLVELKHDIKKLYKKTYQNIDNAWTLKEESIRKIAMCQQGKIAEATLKYKQAHIDKKHLDKFSHGFSQLIELISKDYIYYSFESQTKRNKIATHLSISYQMPDLEQRKAKLKSAIITLIEFLRYLGDIKSDFVIQCRKWLRALAKRFLEEGSTENYRFIISQLAKGPVGTADWSADLVECKPYEQVSGFNSVPQYITHCSAILSELFYNLQSRIKYVTATASVRNRQDEDDEDTNVSNLNPCRDQNWSLVDPRFSCTEELNICSSFNNLLPESDIIKFCLRIPVAQIFRAYVKECLNSSSEFQLETDKNYEYVMLKLLTIGTIIIKTYQIGLETFNSIQYGNLIEYLSSQIRRTVIILSDQWAEFKRRLKGIDDALLMRLQVEYDSFMHRSILIILELRESGIWRHLSRIEQEADTQNSEDNLHGWATDSLRPAFTKLLRATGISATQQTSPNVGTSENQITELNSSQTGANTLRSQPSSLTYEFSVEWFKEVSESMLWHILWQFHHNGFVSSCDYHSDNYWLERFQEKSVIYLFVNKIRDSPPGECSYLVNSITSMLLSRTRSDSKLVNYIAAEIFDLTFKHQSVRQKVTKKGLRSLIRCAEKFPNLISLYIQLMGEEEQLDDLSVELIKGCSLNGWLCNADEFGVLENWLIEYPLSATQNKIARLIISKILLNSPPNRFTDSLQTNYNCTDAAEPNCSMIIKNKTRKQQYKRDNCFVGLNLRRKLALILYKASIHHTPANNDIGSQSLGASVEVAFGTGLYCEQTETDQNSLIELAADVNYQQFYIWTWRVLFLLQLHILNQTETDWNDVQSRSGTSRSIKNTVLISDPFHPAPSIEDSECLQLAEGLKNQTPIASFIYLVLTDATWQVDSLDTCVANLNILANSGHITPSLMAMKFFTICHLNDLADVLMKDKKCVDYFTTIILSNFDATRLASLIATQLDHLKQYRQLQLSYFYIGILLEVNQRIAKNVASSWFSSDEISFEKIACILDYIVRFNFATQRFEIVRKFYDCAYIVHDDSNQTGHTNSWLGSLLTTNSSQRELFTNLHLLAQKFKKYAWLQWVTTECDTLRLEKIWEDIVVYLSSNEEANSDSAIKKVCPNLNASSLKSTLPIYSWIRQIFDIMELDLNHPLCPLIWYNFFLNYFANSLNGVSVGFKLVSPATITKLLMRLDSLYNYHLYKQKNWSSTSVMQQNSLTELYRAYKFWLQDPSLRDAYIDIDRLREEYQVSLLKAVMESSNVSVCLRYIDLQSIETQNKNMMQIWLTSTNLIQYNSGDVLDDSIMYFDSQTRQSLKDDPLNDTGDDFIANDAVSLIVGSYGASSQQAEIISRCTDDAHEELCRPLSEDYFGKQKYQTTDELMEVVKKNFLQVFEESSLSGLNMTELERTKNEIIDLVGQLYTNEKREFVRVVSCVEGNECAGPARIKFEAEEALIDERKSQCVQDRRRQCQDLVTEVLSMPKNRTVLSTIIIEETLRRLIGDQDRTKFVIESLLNWVSEPANHNQLNGSYYAANHLLKTSLEILSTTNQVDAYNCKLFDVCLAHPGSIQIFSPYLTPSACSNRVFLDLYKTISSKQSVLGPNATFVLLSKFDLNAYLNANPKCRQSHHELIVTTCSAFKDIGKNPEELTMDLFKRHLQVELASPDRRKSEELLLVVSQFLDAMNEQVLAPDLWLYYLAIIGLERNTNKTKVNHLGSIKSTSALNSRRDSSNQMAATAAAAMALPTTMDDSMGAAVRAISSQHPPEHSASLGWVAEDVSRLADCQSVFDYHSLDKLVKMICELMKQRHNSSPVTLLELYKDYLEQYGLLMLSVTFMWLKSISELYPDNHELIWRQFMDLWYDWVFLTKNCQNVSKSNYSLMVNYFVMSLQYMIHRIPESTGAILRSLLSDLSNYIVETREIVYLELTILQRCLKNLPWSSMLATANDINHLAIMSEQENYNVFDLVSHILMEINTKESLMMIQKFDPANMARVAERLATTIIYHSTHLKGYKLYGSYFSSIATDDTPRLTNLILARIEFINLEHSHNNKLLVKLLKCICIDTPNNGSPREDGEFQMSIEVSMAKRFERAVIYARFISDYLVNLIKRHPIVANCNKKYVCSIMNNSMHDLEPILTSNEIDLSQKTILYASLLKCCNCDVLESDSRMLLARSVVEPNLLTNKPRLVIELVHALGQFMSDSKILVTMVEASVDLYCSLNDHQYDEVWKNFSLRLVSGESYLNNCVEERAPLALMVYFESLFDLSRVVSSDELGPTSNHHQQQPLSNQQIWSRLFYWLSKLNQSLSSPRESECLVTSKLTTVWIRVLVLLESQLGQYLVDAVGGQLVSTDVSATKTDHQQEPEKLVDGSSETGQVRAGVADSDNVKSTKTKAGNSRLVGHYKVNAACLADDHKCLLGFIKQLISFYDSINTGGLWSYLKSSNRSEQSSRVSVTALAVAYFMADRALLHLTGIPTELPPHLILLRDELAKMHRIGLAKLETAQRSKKLPDCSQFIETLIGSTQHTDKVQYCEGVQLITTYALAH